MCRWDTTFTEVFIFRTVLIYLCSYGENFGNFRTYCEDICIRRKQLHIVYGLLKHFGGVYSIEAKSSSVCKLPNHLQSLG